ncbi:MAG TPA: hypothetical protein VNJ07_01385 [Chitinophagales bacterium]|nr:hypothetical protein [Chitinophagales bacterium]
MKLAKKIALKHLEDSVKDEALRKKLTPAYAIGCKRVLLSNDYYPALQRANAEVITEAIREINETGIITADGKYRAADAIILATGFHAAEGVLVYDVKGRNGYNLNDAWQDGAEAYLGTTIAGFPNFFLIVGPNTGLGHSSMIIMIEAQVHYVMECIKAIRKNNWKFIDVKSEAQKAYNDELQHKLKQTVWQTGGCTSWYQNRNGKNVALWPYFTFTFRRRTRKFEKEKYEAVR